MGSKLTPLYKWLVRFPQTGDRRSDKPKVNLLVATVAAHQDLIRAISEEIALGVETAVDCWMTQIDSALSDTRLTTLGRLNAINEIVHNYKLLTGRAQFD